MQTKSLRILAALVLAVATVAQAQTVQISEPWVRATVPQQKATGAFMRLTAASDMRLVEVSSPQAGIVEIHEMAMVKDVMKMRAVDGLSLPAGKMVELKPGGYHVMLMDLKAQVKEGDTVPINLVVQSPDGKRHNMEIKAVAKALNTPAHGMKH